MEYKFRGKRIIDNRWIYGSLISWPDGDKEIIITKSEEEADKYSVFPESVGMFTGQVFNKKELFEGDIVEVEYHDWALNRVGINPFNEDKAKKIIRLLCRYGVDSSFHLNRIDDGSNACYSVQFSGSAVMRKVIIGNMTDHPHLLNPAKGAVTNTMNNLDPNTTQAAEGQQEVKDQTTQEVAATEQEAQEKAMESEETEG